MAKISKALRFEILRRDNFTCRYCGRSAPDVALTVDHVVPDTLGGTADPTNLVAACPDCNAGKSAVPPGAPLIQDVEQDAIRWRRAMEKAAEIRRADRDEREAYAGYFSALWNEWSYGPSYRRQPVPLDDDWRATIDKFWEHGIEPDDLVYAVRTAMSHQKVQAERTFRYFCGICWNMIREAQRIAADIVMTEVEDLVNDDIEDTF